LRASFAPLSTPLSLKPSCLLKPQTQCDSLLKNGGAELRLDNKQLDPMANPEDPDHNQAQPWDNVDHADYYGSPITDSIARDGRYRV
jgi:hypothetical protein